MTENNNKDVSYRPKRKRNVFFGIVLLIFSFGLLLNSIQDAHGEIARLLGLLVVVFVIGYYGVKMIIGKEIK